MVFAIADTPFENHIIASTYKVNDPGAYEEWTDAGNYKHKRKLREHKIVGSFSMFFKTLAEFKTFNSAVKNNTGDTNAVPVYLTVNDGYGISDDRSALVYLTYEPVRNRDGNWQDYMLQFNVKIEER